MLVFLFFTPVMRIDNPGGLQTVMMSDFCSLHSNGPNVRAVFLLYKTTETLQKALNWMFQLNYRPTAWTTQLVSFDSYSYYIVCTSAGGKGSLSKHIVWSWRFYLDGLILSKTHNQMVGHWLTITQIPAGFFFTYRLVKMWVGCYPTLVPVEIATFTVLYGWVLLTGGGGGYQ